MKAQQQIEALLHMNTLSQNDFDKIDGIIESMSADLKRGLLSRKDIATINTNFGEDFLENTIQGYGLRKPYGYAGDFLMIDKIYTYATSENPKFKIWDEYFHRQSAPKAVRNRKAYFKKIIAERTNVNPQLELLDVASGPARDLFEMYSHLPSDKKIKTTCVEMDKNAVAYAQKLNKAFLDEIHFIQQNIFKYKEDTKYDIIWSAGLFDYFNDKAFLFMLKRFKKWLKPDGEIIIGNFNENHNPSRDYMEIFGEWFLIHRTEEQLKKLAMQAGFEKQMIHIDHEPENVNLFLHIRV